MKESTDHDGIELVQNRSWLLAAWMSAAKAGEGSARSVNGPRAPGAVPFQYLGMIDPLDTAPYVLLEHYGSRCVIPAEQATNTRAQRFFTKLAVELLIAAARTRKSEPAKIVAGFNE